MKKAVIKFSRFSVIALAGIFIYAGLRVSAHHHKNIEDQNKKHKDCQICINSLNDVAHESKPPVLISQSPVVERVLDELASGTFGHILYTNNQPHAPPLEVL